MSRVHSGQVAGPGWRLGGSPIPGSPSSKSARSCQGSPGWDSLPDSSFLRGGRHSVSPQPSFFPLSPFYCSFHPVFWNILEQQSSVPHTCSLSSFPPARNVRPKMTIYVCQELEQSRVPLQQKRDGSGDPNLCGELWGAPPLGW